ncbi:MAG: orc1/cdc6 family replication initiation protein [Bacteroidales bacterium]|nr:orc1/cdc6 family replication initiation protein [Bacteroidales bacterium]MBN2755676.1 orc1/cdc6 family replication initiation protein [Bacteroidales bacterium]
MNKEEKLHLINEIFTPSAPIENINLFSGRDIQLKSIKETILEKGQHAVMYGNRGVGKTSLSNMVSFMFEDIITIKVTCNRNDDFKTIWERALKKVKFGYPIKQVGYKAEEKMEVFPIQVPDLEQISPTEIENTLFNINENMVFIFDEFDIIKNPKIKAQMADIIKLLSDNLPFITIILVGIAESVEDLFGQHPSVERCIKQIELPLMGNKEAKKILNRNLKLLSLKIDDEISEKIIELSSGFPNYVHLLCKYSSEKAVSENKTKINIEHFNYAVKRSIDNSDHSIKKSYSIATKSSTKTNRFANVLLACALANTDEYNSFSSVEVIEKYNKITGELNKTESLNYNLGMLCKKERAEILSKEGKQKSRYKFRKPLLKAFIKLKQHDFTVK